MLFICLRVKTAIVEDIIFLKIMLKVNVCSQHYTFSKECSTSIEDIFQEEDQNSLS